MRPALVAILAVATACGRSNGSTAADGGGADAIGGQDAAGGPDSASGDAQPPDSAADSTPPPACGTGGWLTYGHDGARTFASDACINGPLARSWAYAPAPPTGRTLNAVQHALATSTAVYLQWAASDGMYVGTTAVDGLSPAGARLWTFDSGTDANMGNWASVGSPVTVDGSVVQSLVADDDGVYFLDLATGKSRAGTGVDWWGQSIPDASGGVWFVDTSKSDGPGLSVGQLDSAAKMAWQQNKQGTTCGDSLSDQMGGIALDGGVLFYAPFYVAGGSVQPTFKSGLYAFDAVTGAPKWNVATTPSSVISAGNGLVYGVEAGALVARGQSDGSSQWSKPLSGAGVQAPVLAAGLVIAASATGVSAFDATTGSPAWSTPITGAAAAPWVGTLTNGCAGSQNEGGAVATSIAAAVPSGTLVVTASDGVHVLSLTTGQDKWHGPVTGAVNAVHDPVLVGDMVYVVDSPPAPYLGFGPGQLIALKGS
jgi:outer membrane protein assembly factor BamB